MTLKKWKQKSGDELKASVRDVAPDMYPYKAPRPHIHYEKDGSLADMAGIDTILSAIRYARPFIIPLYDQTAVETQEARDGALGRDAIA